MRPAGKFTVQDRRILFLMAIAALAAGYGGSLITHTLPFARKDLGLSEGAMSWVFAATRAVSLTALVFSARGDRTGRRGPFLIAFALIPTASLLTALLPSVAAFTVLQSIGRVGVIGVAALSIVILSEELTPAVRGYGIGVYALAGSMGTGFSLILLPIAESSPSAWRILFGIGGLGLLAYPLLRRFLRETRAFAPAPHVRFRAALRAGLGRHFWPLAGIAFFVAAFSSPAFDFALERMIDDLAWEAAPARFLLIVFSGAGTVGLLLGGRLADTTGRRPTTIAAIILGLVGGVGFYTTDSGWLLAPSIFLATMGATMLTPAFGAHRAELFPTRVRATAGAWVTNVAILGSIAGFAAGGLLIDRLGLPRTISLLAIGLIAAAALVLRLPETKGRDLIGRRAAPAPATTPGSRPGPASGRSSPTRRRTTPSPGDRRRRAP
jgi:MFS family permease